MTSALKNFSLNGSQIKRSNTTCTESRPSTGKSLQPRPLTTSSTAKRAQYMRKTKNEIERWAYNDDRVEIGYESDEIKSVDDDYIDKIAEKDYEEIVLDKRTMEKKQQRVHHILKNMRDAKRFYLEMAKKNPDYEFKLEDYGIKEMTIGALAKSSTSNNTKKTEDITPKKKDVHIRKGSSRRDRSGNVSRNGLSDISKMTVGCTFDIRAYEAIKADMEEADREREEEERNKAPKEEVKSDKSIKYKNAKNGLSRMVPGKLQQNITLERAFFKDLLKLSRERYITRLNSDYQKRKFVEAQSKKGLCDEEKRSSSSRPKLSASASIKTSSQTQSHFKSEPSSSSETAGAKSYNYKARSISAHYRRNLLSTPIDRLQSSACERRSIQPSQTPAITEIDDEEDSKREAKSGNLAKNPITSTSKLSLRSGSSLTSATTTITEYKYRSPLSNWRPNTTEEALVESEKSQRIRCVSAYEKRKTDLLVKQFTDKENKNISPVLSVKDHDEMIKAVENVNLAKSRLKRPNTSIPYHRVNKTNDSRSYLLKKELEKSSDEEEIPVAKQENPVSDKRYTTLLSSMAGCYPPKNCGEFSVNVDERVSSLISGNTALQSYDGADIKRNSRVHMNKNMVLFEKLITNYF